MKIFEPSKMALRIVTANSLNRYLVVCETGRIQAALIAMIYRVKLHAESSEKAESTIRELKQNLIFGQRHRRILNGLS